MKKKHLTHKSVFGGLLCAMLMLSSMPVTAFAQNESADAFQKEASVHWLADQEDSSHSRNHISYVTQEDSIAACTLAEGETSGSESTTSYNLTVGDITVTSANATDILGNGTASYDAETQTLTLNNASISTTYNPGVESTCGIHCESDLTIRLIGNNTIHVAAGNQYIFGIDVYDTLTLTGSGLLNITCGDINYTATETGKYAESTAISAGSVILEDATVIATGGNVTCTGTDSIDDTAAYSSGVYSDENLTICDGATLHASAKTATAPKARSYGIDMYGLFSMKNATVTVTGSTSTGVSSARSMGLYGAYDMSIDQDSVFDAVSGNVSAEDAHTYAIHCYSSEETTLLIDGQITAHSGDSAGSESAFTLGFFTCHSVEISERGSITASAGNATGLVAQSHGMQISKGDLHIMGGRLELNASDAVGISGDSEESTTNSTGLYIIGTLTASDGAHFTAIGKKSSGDIAYSNGVGVKDGAVTIQQATVTISSGDVNGKVRSGSIAVELVNDCDSFYVFNNAADVTITSGTAISDTKAFSNGICGYSCDIGFAGGKTSVTSGKWDAPLGDGYAIYSGGKTDTDGCISGGFIHFACDEQSIDPDDYHTIGTNVTILAPYSEVLYARCGVEVDDKTAIRTPKAYAFTGHGTYDPVMEYYEYYTMTDGENNPVKEMIVEPRTYTVTINDGISSEPEKLTVPAGFSVNAAYTERYQINDFSERYQNKREGYQLDGFYQNASYTDESKYSFTNAVTEDITLYAKWSKLGDNNDSSNTGNSGNTGNTSGSTNNGNSNNSNTNTGNSNNSNTNNGNNSNKNNTPAPRTGDNSQILMWAVVMVLGGVVIYKKRTLLSAR